MPRNQFTEDAINFLQAVANQQKVMEARRGIKPPYPSSEYVQDMVDELLTLSDESIQEFEKVCDINARILMLIDNIGPEDERVITKEEINNFLMNYANYLTVFLEVVDYEHLHRFANEKQKTHLPEIANALDSNLESQIAANEHSWHSSVFGFFRNMLSPRERGSAATPTCEI